MKCSAAVWAIIEPAVTALGYECWGCEFHAHPRHAVLRVYIDSAAGVTVDDCAKVSAQVSALLDVEDPIPGRFELEVSSPGLDRPLFELAQFQRYLGRPVQIRLRQAQYGRKRFSGVLQAAQGDEISVLVDNQPYVLSLHNIDKANVRG